MADAEFENMSNADLRAKCREYGLPNVPVSDSTRSVLIKKLRAAITGDDGKPPPKPSKRRETVHGTKAPEGEPKSSAKESSAVAATRSPSRGRRTLAATPVPEPTAAPVAARRRSTMERELQQQQQQQQKQQQQQQQQQQKPTPKARRVSAVVEEPISLLESDNDEEEEEIFRAAIRAEQESRAAATLRNRRSVSLSKNTVTTTSYSRDASPLLSSRAEVAVEKEKMPRKQNRFVEEEKHRRGKYEVSPERLSYGGATARRSYATESRPPVAPYVTESRPKVAPYAATQQRQYSPPRGGTPVDRRQVYTPSYRRDDHMYPQLRSLHNEQSDDAVDSSDELKARRRRGEELFESDYARHLARVQAEKASKQKEGAPRRAYGGFSATDRVHPHLVRAPLQPKRSSWYEFAVRTKIVLFARYVFGLFVIFLFALSMYTFFAHPKKLWAE